MFMTLPRFLLLFCAWYWPLDATIDFVEVICLPYCYLLHCLSVIIDVFYGLYYLSIYLLWLLVILSSKNIKHTFDSMTSKQFFATILKLNGVNYLLWAQSLHFFVDSQKKLKHLTEDPQVKGTDVYNYWEASDCSVLMWLLNSMMRSMLMLCF